MARVRYRIPCQDASGNRLNGASVAVFDPNTTDVISATIFGDFTGVDTLSNPMAADAQGVALFYLDAPKRVDVKISKTGYDDQTIPDVEGEIDASDTLPGLLTAQGDLVYASAANNPERLAMGTAGQALVVNDAESALEWATSATDPTVVSITNADSPYTVPGWSYDVYVDASGGAVTVILPTAVDVGGKRINVSKIDSSGNTVTVDGNAAETINGSATLTLRGPDDSYTLASNGANVRIV